MAELQKSTPSSFKLVLSVKLNDENHLLWKQQAVAQLGAARLTPRILVSIFNARKHPNKDGALRQPPKSINEYLLKIKNMVDRLASVSHTHYSLFFRSC